MLVKEIMKVFSQAKAWQLFTVMMLPMLMPPFMISSGGLIKWLPVITLLWAVVLIGWYYTIGASSNASLPRELQKNPRLYQLGFVLPLGYLGATVLGFGFPIPNSENIAPTMPIWLVVLHLTSMAGMFYGLWFTAKQFTALRKQGQVQFIDYSGPFFLLWFAPIGVWFIQPKVNELLGEPS